MKAFVSSGLAVFFLISAGASSAFACSCSAAPTVLDEFARSPIVVKARLDSFEELDRSVAGTNVYRTMAAVLTVEKVFKGPMKVDQTFRILDGTGGDCTAGIAREKVGQEFLFYTGPATQIGRLKGRLHLISRCSRSARIEEAAPDLSYLENRAKLAGQTRLSGTIKRFSADPPSLAGIAVDVTGPNVYETTQTDERGFFEFWNLPAGQYKVSFHLTGRIRLRDFWIVPGDRTWRRQVPPDNAVPIVLGPRKHTEVTVGIESR